MSKGILSGIRVLELANVLAGPGVGAMLAELGAEVIKIENLLTSGDVTRTWKLPSEDPSTDISAYFSCVNWGKKSVALDLIHPEGLNLIHASIKYFDIVLASYKPGDAEKLKVDYANLQPLNPRLIYAHLTGYGLENKRAGYDAIIQAETGFTFINGEAGCRPVKMPVALMDILAGHHLKEAILLALYQRERTGLGTFTDVSLFRSGVTSLANQATNWLVGNCIPQAMGSDHPNIVPYGTVYDTLDKKHLVLAIGTDSQFRDLCKVLEAEHLATDDRYINNLSRVQNRESLQSTLKNLIKMQERDTLLEKLEKYKIPAGGVFNMKEVFEQPEAQPLIHSKTTDEGNQLKGVSAIAFSMKGHTFANVPEIPPHYGQHTAGFLAEVLGLSEKEIQSLIKKNVIYDRNNP